MKELMVLIGLTASLFGMFYVVFTSSLKEDVVIQPYGERSIERNIEGIWLETIGEIDTIIQPHELEFHKAEEAWWRDTALLKSHNSLVDTTWYFKFKKESK